MSITGGESRPGPGTFRGRDEDPRLDDAIDILSEVSMKSLTVTPDAIGPFGAAILRWNVEGPTRGFVVELNGRRVARQGERVVQPRATTLYSVVAVARGARSKLGSVTLTVDLDRCDTFRMAIDLRSQLEGALANSIEGGGIYLRSRPVVTITPGRIRFRLRLGKDLDDKPDPTIRIEGSFGLDVQDGELVSVGERVTADVSVPKWVWLIPGAMVALPPLLNNAEQEARAGGQTAIAGLVDLLALSWTTADGIRRHSVRIEALAEGNGVLEVTECPSDELRKLARLASERTTETNE